MAAAILILSAASCGENQTYGDDVEPIELPTSSPEPGCHMSVNRSNILWLYTLSEFFKLFHSVYIYGDPIEYNDYPLAEKMGFDPDDYTLDNEETGRRAYKKGKQTSLSVDKYGRFDWTYRPDVENGETIGEEKSDAELGKIARDFLDQYDLFNAWTEKNGRQTGLETNTSYSEEENRRIEKKTSVTFTFYAKPDGINYREGKINVTVRADGKILNVRSRYINYASRKRAEMISVNEAIDLIEQDKCISVGGMASGDLVVSGLWFEYWTYEDDLGTPAVLQPVYRFSGSVKIRDEKELAERTVQANRF